METAREVAADPYLPMGPLFAIAKEWAMQGEGQREYLALILDALGQSAGWRLSIHRTPKGVGGVAVVMPDGDWLLEATDETGALMLANMAVVQGRLPARLITSEQVGEWLRPHLAATGHLAREGRLASLVCEEVIGESSGGWAGPDDLHGLHGWLRQNDGVVPGPAPAWENLLAFRKVAVARSGEHVVAVARWHGKTASSAGLAYVRSSLGVHGTGVEAKLARFITGELLKESPSVRVLVELDNTTELDFYRSLNFKAVQTHYAAAFV